MTRTGARLFVLSCCALIAFSFSLKAQTISPFQFLRTNINARTAALGEATVAAMDDSSATSLNPAALHNSPAGKVSLTFIKHVLDINSGLASYVFAGANRSKWGMFVSFQSHGTFDGMDALGNPTGQTYSPSGVAVGATYSNEIDTGFYYGVGLNLINSHLSNSSSTAFGINAGLLYHIPNSRWNVGLAATNIGAQLSSFNGASDPMPADVRIGVNHRLRGLPLLVNFSFNHLVDQNQALFDHFKNFSLGGELYLGKIIQVRLGYNNTIHNAASLPVSSNFAGISAGVGIALKSLSIDYGMNSLISGIMIHRFSVQTVL